MPGYGYARGRRGASGSGGAGAPADLDGGDPEETVNGSGGFGMAGARLGGGVSSHPLPDDLEGVDLPEGINVEEARMLEAAMLGIPYTGRMPTFGEGAAAAPVDPEARAQRALRREQDEAYEESLAADR